MSKRLAFAIAVLACVGIAYGAAVKIRGFDNIAEPNLDADGMAILNYISGQDETMVQIIVSDFTPGLVYDVVLVSPSHSFEASSLGVLEVDSHGHGNLHLTVPAIPGEGGDWTDSDVEIWINLGIPPPAESELRAVGSNPP